MVLSAIMGFVCVGLIVALYIFSGGWKSHGGIVGIWKWLSQGGLSNPSTRLKLGAVKKSSNVEDDVAEVLEEIYNEFTDKLHRQSQELQNELNDSLLEMRGMVQALEERLSKLEDAKLKKFEQNVVDGIGVSNKPSFEQTSIIDEPIYFRILDEIRNGISPEQIASILDVSIRDVETVLHILETPRMQS